MTADAQTVAPAFTDVDVARCAKKLSLSSPREREILRDGANLDRADAAKKLGMTEDSFDTRFASVCTKIGIPKAGGAAAFDRRAAGRRVWRFYVTHTF